MNKAGFESEDRSVLRFLLWGLFLLALPLIALGVMVLFVMPAFPRGFPETPDWVLWTCLVAIGGVLLAGLGSLIAAAVMFISSENRPG